MYLELQPITKIPWQVGLEDEQTGVLWSFRNCLLAGSTNESPSDAVHRMHVIHYQKADDESALIWVAGLIQTHAVEPILPSRVQTIRPAIPPGR